MKQMVRCKGVPPQSTMFTDVDAAVEEAEFLANLEVPGKQRRSAYLVQYGNVIRVHLSPPKRLPVMMTVKPKPKLWVSQ